MNECRPERIFQRNSNFIRIECEAVKLKVSQQYIIIEGIQNRDRETRRTNEHEKITKNMDDDERGLEEKKTE